MATTPVITGYGGPAVRADTLQVIGRSFGRVSGAFLVDADGLQWDVPHKVDSGSSVTITVPRLLPDGIYLPVFTTLDNLDSQNLAGPLTLPALPEGPPLRPPPADPVPDPDSVALATIRHRLRLELGDYEESFQATVQGDGFTRRFDLPAEVVDPASFTVVIAEELADHSGYATPAPVAPEDYTLDARAGVLLLNMPPANDAIVTVTGQQYQFFTDEELNLFIRSAALKHSHSSEELQVYRDQRGFKRFLYTNQTVDGLNPVEHHAVALLAATEALEVVRTDAAYDIDVVTADGTSLPRSERFRNIGELIAEKRTVYDDLCRQLGVGLSRIEVFTMRRVSRTTNRLVPVYVSREYDDRSPVAPLRVHAPRNLGITGTGFVQRETYHRGFVPPPLPEEDAP